MSKIATFLSVYGSELARLHAAAVGPGGLIDDFFPTTAAAMLTEWEEAYGLTDHTGDTASRRRRLAAKVSAFGGQSRDYFYLIAEKLGYNRYPSTVSPRIHILDGMYVPFRCGISQVGVDKLYDPSSGTAFSWIVQGTGVEDDTALVALFTEFGPSHLHLEFENE